MLNDYLLNDFLPVFVHLFLLYMCVIAIACSGGDAGLSLVFDMRGILWHFTAKLS